MIEGKGVSGQWPPRWATSASVRAAGDWLFFLGLGHVRRNGSVPPPPRPELELVEFIAPRS